LSARVDNVLGEYDHSVAFGENDDFIIVYGPNGVGKTKFLEIIHALSQLDGRSLARLPFSTAILSYSESIEITVSDPEFENGGLEERPALNRHLRFVIRDSEHQIGSWEYTGDGFEDWIIEETTWRPIDDEYLTWEDRIDGEITSISDLKRRYSNAPLTIEKLPDFAEDFKSRVRSYLIETQRLRIEQQHTDRRVVQRRASGRAKHSSKITEYATTMRRFVNEAQTEHSRITQQLDRTFPNRVVAGTVGDSAAEQEVRDRYNRQNGFRSRLGRVASVTLEDALSLPARNLDQWELRLLDLYLDDADKKLAPFELLLQKIELLEEIVNSRLLRKRLQVTAGEGLTVQHESDKRAISLDSLSSGEQHEVILIFDLLFNVPNGAIVLIDEPEISLHVVWQLAFIPDVQRIAELADFRFLVATHSPQIINDSWNRAIRLGPEQAEFS
jgi:predicted ATP-binding protein involved in virulence